MIRGMRSTRAMPDACPASRFPTSESKPYDTPVVAAAQASPRNVHPAPVPVRTASVFEQVAGAAGEAVQPCPRQPIPGGEPSEHLTQRCPVCLRAADDVPIHLDRPCGGQYRNLRLDVLAIWRDACIAIDHALMMHIAFAQRKPNEISSSLRAKLVIFAQMRVVVV